MASPPLSLLDTLSAVDDAIAHNAEIAEAILDCGLRAFGLPRDPSRGAENDWKETAERQDIAKAHSTIRQFYRDWSREGLTERNNCNLLVFDDLHSARLHPSAKILVPGAGLGRLTFDLALAGYNVEGVEISYHQLLASNWVLNHIENGKSYSLHPFATTFTNVVSRRDQLREVLIPDIHPGEAHAACADGVGQMNMTASDFVLLYGEAASRRVFDVVVTVFFIDTAPNLIRYIETIKNCLKDNGIWINVGPLLWHFDDRAPKEGGGMVRSYKTDVVRDRGIDEPGSFELTNEEVVALVMSMGFTIEHQDVLSSRGTGYIQDPHSMLQHMYHVSHWVARKSNIKIN